jgi:hypothetical protein
MGPLFTSMAYINLTDGAPGLPQAGGGRQAPASPTPHRRRRARRTTATAIGALLALALLAGTAHARESVFAPAPSYPNSTLAIKVVGQPRAGGVVRIAVTGSNAPFEIGYPGSGDYLSYQLDAFAQNGNVLPTCPRSFTEELQNEINLGISRIAQGFNEGYYGPFGTPIQFRAGPRIRNVVVCAYSRMIEDDAAVSALGIRLKVGHPRRFSSRF